MDFQMIVNIEAIENEKLVAAIIATIRCPRNKVSSTDIQNHLKQIIVNSNEWRQKPGKST